MVDNVYYRDTEGQRVYFVNNKRIGLALDMVKWLMANEKVSPSKAHKAINKIKEGKNVG